MEVVKNLDFELFRVPYKYEFYEEYGSLSCENNF